jgi:hypothetical protein
MANTVGKISGQVLESNLIRQGEDLAFETELLYLDVNNNRIGINTDTPFRTLLVAGNTKTTNLLADTGLTVPNFTIVNNTISVGDGNIELSATGAIPSIVTTSIRTDGITIDTNRISSNRSNEDIDIKVFGSGEILFNNNVEITGSLHASGNITFDGSLTLGSDNTDNISFNADIASNIMPDITNTYSLGSSTTRWNTLFTNFVNGQNYTTGGATIGGVTLDTRPGNTWFVATNGNNSNVGNHQNGPFATIEWALGQATSGDTVYIYPGTYVELFPLVVPTGVTVKGDGIRSVKIVPDTASTHEDVFKLNGETTVEDLTIADFFYDSGLDKGYAFSFAADMLVSSRSPYVRNISVITKGSVTSIGDPLGYDQLDAGRGALIDGSVANINSKEASMLFHSVTFITPGAAGIIMKNGVRVEWLNCFIYFASEGMLAESTSVGFANNGKTRLKIYGISAQTVNPGDTVSVENITAANTFTTATIESVTYSAPHTYLVIDGLITGWQESTAPPDTSNQQTITFSGGQTASHLEVVDYTDFGAELRSIGSASVYGGVGAKADGLGTLMYLISHNFGYIGSGKSSINDPSVVVEADQAIELNGGKIYYQSLDQEGNFKVGEIFKVEGKTGNIIFQSALFATDNLTITNGVDITYIDAFEVSTSNITFTGNTIKSNDGPVNFISANNVLSLDSNVSTTKNLITGNIVANQNFIIGSSSVDRFSVNARVASTIAPTVDKDLGSLSNNFKNLYVSQLILDAITIDTNVIATTVTNANLELAANAAGIVRIADSLTLGQNLTVQGLATFLNSTVLTSLSSSGQVSINSLSASQYSNSDILIDDNFITTTLSNSNLELRANNTGGVIFENTLKVVNSTLSNIIVSGTEAEKSITFTPAAGNYLDINSTSALILPLGSNANRVLATSGEIRFNDISSLFEGRVTGGTISLYGLFDVDRNTSISAELTPGANDDTIRMTINGVVKTTITDQRVLFDALRVDELAFDNNVISTFNSNADITLDTSGTGVLNIADKFNVSISAITNIVNDAPTLITSTGLGYVKFDGNKAIVVPAGTTAEQPVGLPIGATRWNIDGNYLEAYDGANWNLAAGGGATIDAEAMEDLSDEWALIFG